MSVVDRARILDLEEREIMRGTCEEVRAYLHNPSTRFPLLLEQQFEGEDEPRLFRIEPPEKLN